MGQFLELAGGAAACPQCAFRCFADLQLSADASEIFPDFQVAAIKASSKQAERPFGKNLAEKVMSLVQPRQFFPPDDFRFLDMLPSIAQQVVEIGDRYGHSRNLPNCLSTSPGRSNQYSRSKGSICVSTTLRYQ